MIDIRDKAQHDKELLSQRCELHMFVCGIIQVDREFARRVVALQDALALASKAGFHHQMCFK
jgi:hypothetical protein